MTDGEMQERIDKLLAQGFEIVQQGRVLIQDTDPGAARLSFAERVEGFHIHLLGTYRPPTYRSQYENQLFDNRERWVHLRRLRAMADQDENRA